MTKNMDWYTVQDIWLSPCFSFPFLKKKKVSCTCLILQEGCCLEWTWNVARKLKPWMSSFSAYTLFSFSPVVHEQCDLDKMQCHLWDPLWGRGIVLHGHQTVSNELLWFPTRCQLGNTICLLISCHIFCKESFCPKEFGVTQEIVINKRNLIFSQIA